MTRHAAKRCAGLTCAYCPAPATTLDHIMPRALSREDRRNLQVRNLRPACFRCNQLRAVLGHSPVALAGFHMFRNSRHDNAWSDRAVLVYMGALKTRRPRQSWPTLADVWPTEGRRRVAEYLEGL